MKTKILITALLILGASTAILYQNCSGGGGSSNGSSFSCDSQGLTGTWSGTISGNPDIMTVSSACSITSSYCDSTTQYNITATNIGCPNGSQTCGQGTATWTSSNGNSGCAPQGTTATCVYVTWNNGHGLTYNCGGNSITYSR